ncbi:MAG: 16S rRNA (cytidine(1402)-2'-O)-methyltransferase [Acidobacteria bacterium]|nr:MAG: 16S rRNA (cytidine(1402)-2'-O)-methyltransferase [Acidobacteriota bacterium]
MPTSREDEFQTTTLAPGLYIVATPIGNLEDITLRALRVLRQADLIACEDTRHTQKLLNHFEIKIPTQSYHEHNEAARARELVERVAAGERVALVSDAGMPGISDPGERVIRAAVERGLNVVAIPGPSALVTALVASGLPTETFRFVGFLPARSGERRSVLESLASVPETLVFYEAPHRIADMLHDVENVFGPDRRIVIARELTKVHEEFVRGSVSEVLAEFGRRDAARGEMTVIVAGKSKIQQAQSPKRNLVERIHELMTSESLAEKDALKQAAREFGLSKSEAYREWQRKKQATGTRARGTAKQPQ